LSTGPKNANTINRAQIMQTPATPIKKAIYSSTT
jgi:hypothetical protein